MVFYVLVCLKDVVVDGKSCFVVDLFEVFFIDSIGLGILVFGFKVVCKVEGDLCFVVFSF